jgi:hypothetical protein
MRPNGKAKLGFDPLPVPEAVRLRNCLNFPPELSALDPCIGDSVAFQHLLQGTQAHCYGIEIDANRAEQARSLGMDTLQASTFDVRSPAEAFSLLYLNPQYDFEIGETSNQRLELVFLEHTYRWLKPGGVLIFVIPQPQLKVCARILSEHFNDLSVFKLTETAASDTSRLQSWACVASDTRICGTPRCLTPSDGWRCWPASPILTTWVKRLEFATRFRCPEQSRSPMSVFRSMKWRICCRNQLRTARRAASSYPNSETLEASRSRHCMADMLACSVPRECSTGNSGKAKTAPSPIGASVKFTDHWEEEEEDGTRILHDREQFSHELTLVFVDGKTQILTHEKKEPE